ncbi:MAG: hypothetical protein WC201_04900, partial [Bacilli bacterium]
MKKIIKSFSLKKNKKTQKLEKKINITIYDIIVIILLLGLAVYTGFHLSSHLLLANSARSFYESLVYYFKNIFSNGTVSDDGLSILNIDESITKSLLPVDFEVFGWRFLATFELLVNPDNIKSAWWVLAPFLKNLAIVLMIIVPPLLLLGLVYHMAVFKNYHKTCEEESKPLQSLKKSQRKVLEPIGRFCKDLFNTWRYRQIGERKIFGFYINYYYAITLLLIAYNINVFSMVFIFIAWYLYFVFSLNISSIYYLVAKLLICLAPLLHPIFIPAWIVLVSYIVIKLKIKAGYMTLHKLYARDVDIVNASGVSLMLVGGPGTGKGSCGVIMQQIMEYLLRTKADSLMMEIRLEFPDFPWRKVEMIIEEKMANKDQLIQFKNKVQVETYFRKLLDDAKIWEEKKVFWSYDFRKQRIIFWDGLKVATLVEEILDYAQLYYIYAYRLTMANFSIRIDKQVLIDECHAAMIGDPFSTDSRNVETYYRAQRIDFNELRIFQKVANAKNAKELTALFDAGVIYAQEYEKERGNKVTNQNRADLPTKPSNDGVPSFVAFFRHLTTVRNTCFGRMLVDGQDINWLAGRETKMIETIAFIKTGKRKTKYAIPLFWIESVLLEWADDIFCSKIKKYIITRNDKTVYSYINGHFASFFRRINRIIWGTFGYESVPMSLSGSNLEGSQVGKGDTSFNLLYKIAYSDKFKTDSYSGFWRENKEMAL